MSQDPYWSKRLIFFFLKKYKNKIVREAIATKNYPINRANYVTIPCIALDRVDQVECPCPPASGFYFLKSKYPVPRALMGQYTSVTTILGNVTIDYVRWDAIKDKLNSRFEWEKKLPFYTLKTINSKTYLYIYNDNDKELVAITSLFEDDLEAYYYPDCNGLVKVVCNPLDEMFVVDEVLLPAIIEITYEKLLKLKGVSTMDILNNETSDVSTSTIK